MGFIEKNWGAIMKHKTLCFAFLVAGWTIAAIFYSGEVRTAEQRLSHCNESSDYAKSQETAQTIQDLRDENEAQMSLLRACDRPRAEACQWILPDIPQHSEAERGLGESELTAIGCMGGECKTPILLKWIGEYMNLRNHIDAATLKTPEITKK